MYAKGNVLATNLLADTSIPKDTILIDPIRQNEYVVTTSVSISSTLETRIPIQAISVGDEYNLNAGNSLISSAFPNVLFYVGDYRTSTGTLCGGIFGGKNIESDLDFRSRIISFLYSSQIGTPEAFLNVLNSNTLIDDFYIDVLFPGIIDVWIFPAANTIISDNDLKNISDSLYSVVPVGIFVNVRIAFYTNIDITLVSSQSLTSDFILNIKNTLNNYLKTLVSAPRPTSASVQNFLFAQYGLSFEVQISTTSYNSSGLYYKINNLNVSYSL